MNEVDYPMRRDSAGNSAYEGWAILELMGHRRIAGRVSEVTQFGVTMCRIDVPKLGAGEEYSTQYYGGSALYCLTPTSERFARLFASRTQPQPVHEWELPRLPDHRPTMPSGAPEEDDDSEDDDDCDIDEIDVGPTIKEEGPTW